MQRLECLPRTGVVSGEGSLVRDDPEGGKRTLARRLAGEYLKAGGAYRSAVDSSASLPALSSIGAKSPCRCRRVAKPEIAACDGSANRRKPVCR
jgi:hypothetical protein